MGTTISAGKRLRAKWDAGEPAFGLWAAIPSSLTAELAAAAGYDYVCVDLQHGGSNEATMISMFQATQGAGSVPLARLAWNEPWLIMRALDLGAAGVILPLIDSAEDAARAVESCRYPPLGRRSYGPVRAELVMGSGEVDDLNADTLCFAMIETRQGLDHVDAIAATEGLDGLYIGPSDLSIALGLSPRPAPGDDRKPLADAIERVGQVCEAHGLIAGIHCSDGHSAEQYASRGFKLVTVGIDTRLLKTTMNHELSVARGS